MPATDVAKHGVRSDSIVTMTVLGAWPVCGILKRMKRILALCIGLALILPRPAAALDSAAGAITTTEMARIDGTPWSLGFLPDGGVLITEREGRLWLLRDGALRAVAGVPSVVDNGQGGLLDVLVPRDFAQTRAVYLSYAKAQGGGAGTALARGRLSGDGTRLERVETLFEMRAGTRGGRHFGGRLVEAADGHIFLTTGDRGQDAGAQRLDSHQGKVLRLTRDGAPAPGNPFLTTPGALPEIWSYGHRNPQGLTFDAQGRLWAHEHGARGGDEVNLIQPGRNYGWPVISYGVQYSGGRIGEGTAKPGMEQPAHYWDPSIAPSGFTIYRGGLFPAWRGDFLVGSLKFDLISRLDPAGGRLREVERIQGAETLRVRDLREAPDGALWMIAEGNGTIWRLTPAK